MSFQLPESLPGSIEELQKLRDDAGKEFDDIAALADAEDTDISSDDLEYLRSLADAIKKIDTEIAGINDAARARKDEAARLVAEIKPAAPADDAEDTGDEDGGDGASDGDSTDQVVAEAEKITQTAAEPVTASAPAPRRTSFAGVTRKTPDLGTGGKPAEPTAGWRMRPDAPGYTPGLVASSVVRDGLASVRMGRMIARPNGPQNSAGFVPQTIATYHRDVPTVEDYDTLTAALDQAVKDSVLPDGSLTAAGWCAPSETRYDFCPVPAATDLVTLPEVTANRGGLRWPKEFDLSGITFQVLCEPELVADPPPVKTCITVPCPDEFDEVRLCALPLCVEAGILQAKAWPESVANFVDHVLQLQLRQRSAWKLQQMINHPTTRDLIIPADTQIGAGSSILNSLNIAAMGVRSARNLSRTAIVDGIAPTWTFEAIRNDIANQGGVPNWTVSDDQIRDALRQRNIVLQFVGDWQELPTNAVEFPPTVDILLYERGAFFALVSDVIDLGVMYPRELLQINMFTQFFTEDGLAVGKRCGDSVVVTVPICPNGAIGDRQPIVCAAGS